MPDSLAGKTVVITGAGRGIGRAIALACARNGADVAVAARSKDQIDQVAAAIQSMGRRALAVATDLREPAQVDQLATTVRREFGDVDLLVNNSGVAGPTKVLWAVSVDEWEETLRVNLTGVFLCCRAFLPAMVERGSGSVIVIGSATGKRPLHGRTPYAASKLGLVGLVRTLAWEAGPHGVRVNLISPGAVDGDRLETVVEAQATARGISADDVRAELAGASPLHRFVEAGHIADAVVFLASDAGASITGEDVNVTAGMTMY
jgi:NAD(P)-dependent dehydrogenase (short-subunit alcohol dehydrogenase family)